MGRHAPRSAAVFAAVAVSLGLVPAAGAQLVQALKVRSNQVADAKRALNDQATRERAADLKSSAAEAKEIARIENEHDYARRMNALIETDADARKALTEVPETPAVLFALGYTGSYERHVVPRHAIGIETNVAGAGLGALFKGIGAEPLRRYFETHATLTALLPAGRSDGAESRVALGLGAIRFKEVTFVPALAIEEADSSDARVPRDVVRETGKHDRWASPALVVGFVHPSLKGVTLSVGVGFPLFYPGGPVEALGKLFAFDGERFERSGRGALTVQIGMPLQATPLK